MTANTRRLACILAISLPILAAGGGSAFAAQPKLRSGKIDSMIIHIGALPRAPIVTLDLHGETERVVLFWTGPNGEILEDYFYTNEPDGRAIFNGTGTTGTFSPYAGAGTWTLTSVYVCSGGCSVYTGAPLTALFPSLTLTVVNPHADTTPPTATAAAVNTPTVVTSSKTEVEVAMTLQDNFSGAVSAQVKFSSPKGTFMVGGGLSYPVTASATYQLTGYLRNYAPGTYTATSVQLSDAAGNQTTITDANKISTLFGGQDTITLTN